MMDSQEDGKRNTGAQPTGHTVNDQLITRSMLYYQTTSWKALWFPKPWCMDARHNYIYQKAIHRKIRNLKCFQPSLVKFDNKQQKICNPNHENTRSDTFPITDNAGPVPLYLTSKKNHDSVINGFGTTFNQKIAKANQTKPYISTLTQKTISLRRDKNVLIKAQQASRP